MKKRLLAWLAGCMNGRLADSLVGKAIRERVVVVGRRAALVPLLDALDLRWDIRMCREISQDANRKFLA